MMPPMSRRSSTDPWIMRHPLATYLVLVFAIAWLFWVPLALLYDGGSDLESLRGSPLVIVLQTLGVTAPLISAIVVTGLTRGKRGVRRLLGGLKRWRVGLWWYAAACLLIPVLTVLALVRGERSVSIRLSRTGLPWQQCSPTLAGLAWS
jgi:uncharacterized protein